MGWTLTRDLEMSANSSSSFSAMIQVAAPRFSWEKISIFDAKFFSKGQELKVLRIADDLS